MTENTAIAIFRIATPVILFFLTLGITFISRNVKKTLRQAKYTDVCMQAMDYALEKSIGNGYKEHRDKAKTDLIKKDTFINIK